MYTKNIYIINQTKLWLTTFKFHLSYLINQQSNLHDIYNNSYKIMFLILCNMTANDDILIINYFIFYYCCLINHLSIQIVYKILGNVSKYFVSINFQMCNYWIKNKEHT